MAWELKAIILGALNGLLTRERGVFGFQESESGVKIGWDVDAFMKMLLVSSNKMRHLGTRGPLPGIIKRLKGDMETYIKDCLILLDNLGKIIIHPLNNLYSELRIPAAFQAAELSEAAIRALNADLYDTIDKSYVRMRQTSDFLFHFPGLDPKLCESIKMLAKYLSRYCARAAPLKRRFVNVSNAWKAKAYPTRPEDLEAAFYSMRRRLYQNMGVRTRETRAADDSLIERMKEYSKVDDGRLRGWYAEVIQEIEDIRTFVRGNIAFDSRVKLVFIDLAPMNDFDGAIKTSRVARGLPPFSTKDPKTFMYDRLRMNVDCRLTPFIDAPNTKLYDIYSISANYSRSLIVRATKRLDPDPEMPVMFKMCEMTWAPFKMGGVIEDLCGSGICYLNLRGWTVSGDPNPDFIQVFYVTSVLDQLFAHFGKQSCAWTIAFMERGQTVPSLIQEAETYTHILNRVDAMNVYLFNNKVVTVDTKISNTVIVNRAGRLESVNTFISFIFKRMDMLITELAYLEIRAGSPRGSRRQPGVEVEMENTKMAIRCFDEIAKFIMRKTMPSGYDYYHYETALDAKTGERKAWATPQPPVRLQGYEDQLPSTPSKFKYGSLRF